MSRQGERELEGKTMLGVAAEGKGLGGGGDEERSRGGEGVGEAPSKWCLLLNAWTAARFEACVCVLS